MKKRRSTPFVDLLTYLAIVPLIILLLVTTGLAGSLAFFKLATRSYAGPITPVTQTHLPTLTPTPSFAPVAQMSGQPAAATPLPMARSVSKPIARTAAPTPDMLSRLIAVVFGVLDSPTTIAAHNRLPTLTPTPVDGAPAVASSGATPVNSGESMAVAGATPTPVPAGMTPVPVVISSTPAEFIRPTPVSAAPALTNLPTPNPVSASPTPTSPPLAIPAALNTGWSFANVQIINQGNVMVIGYMINNTGSAQQINYVTGIFYDDYGQVIPGQHDTYDYWPVEVVPPGGQVPFQLRAYDIQSAGKIDLGVASQPSDQRPRQDFDPLNVTAADTAGNYCVSGNLHNSGGQLQNYLAVVAVIFNDQDKVINFDSDMPDSPADVVGDGTFDFEVCVVNPSGQGVARYELRAFGE